MGDKIVVSCINTSAGIHARVFSIVASCFAGGLVDGSRVMLGDSTVKPMNTCVLLIVAVFRSLSMKTLSTSKLKWLILMMWLMTFSCLMMFGAQFMVVKLGGSGILAK